MRSTYARSSSHDGNLEALHLPSQSPLTRFYSSKAVFGFQLLLYLGAVIFFIMLYGSFIFAASASLIGAVAIDRREPASATVPDYFQTTPELFPGS